MKEELIDWNIRGEKCEVWNRQWTDTWLELHMIFFSFVRSMKDNITQYTKAFIQAVCAPIKYRTKLKAK